MKKENNVFANEVLASIREVVSEIATKIAEKANEELTENNKQHEEYQAGLTAKISEQVKDIEGLNFSLNHEKHNNLSLVRQLEDKEKACRIADENIKKLLQREAELSEANKNLAKQILAMQTAQQTTPTASAPTSATETTTVTLPTTPTASGGRLRHAKFNKILALVQHNVPVFMSGEAGVGKNVIAEQIAEAMGLPFYMSSKLSDEYGIRGYGNAEGKYVESPFYKAFSGGGVFLLDEMDASNSQALVALNTALSSDYYDFPVVGNVKKHPDFRVLANGNTNGNGATEDYNGREALDKSTLDRFAFMEVDYDINIETACAEGDKELVEFVHDCRKACKTMHSNVVLLSYRGISNFKMMQSLSEFTLCEIMETTFLKGLDRDNIELLHNNLSKKSNRYAKVLNDCIWHLSQAA